jgi:hypothetical protein
MRKWFAVRSSVLQAAAVLLVLGLAVAVPRTAGAQIIRRTPCPPYPPCPPIAPSAETGAAPTPGQPGQAQAKPETGVPTEQPPAAEPGPSSDLFAQNLGAASGPASAAPNMIGDFFGSGGIFIGDPFDPFYSGVAPLPGNAIPRFKMAENTSPLPQDRLYFDYSFYNDVPITDPAIGVNAYVPGFEKTFLSGRMSFEMRLPMANTLDSDFFLNGPNATSSGEVGNLGMAWKAILLRSRRLALTGGLAMTAPTAHDTRVFEYPRDSVPDIVIRNQSVHLMPFLGALWTPNQRWFAIGYLQVDVDTNGDPVSVDVYESTPVSIGRYQEPTYMYLDASLGYWAYRRNCPNHFLTGLAPMFEVHVNQGLGRAPVLIDSQEALQVGGDINGNPVHTLSIVDLTVGLHAELYRNTTLTAAYCTAATGDRQFEGQFRLLVNRRF